MEIEEGPKVTVESIEEVPSGSSKVKVERMHSFEKREHAPSYVLQSVAKYLEKPKEERPKVEVQQIKPEQFRPRISTKLKKLKMASYNFDMERGGVESGIAKLIRSSSVQEQRSIAPSTCTLRRAASVVEPQAPVHVLQSVSEYLNKPRDERPKVTKEPTGMSKAHLTKKVENIKLAIEKDSFNEKLISNLINKGEEKQFVPISLVQTNSPVTSSQFLQSTTFPKIAPKNESITSEGKMQGFPLQTEGHVLIDGKMSQFVMHKTSSGGSLSIRPLQVLPISDLNPAREASKETAKRPLLVKQDAIDIKPAAEKSSEVKPSSSQTEVIYLPNANADPTKSLKALRQLEQLSSKFRKETVSGYQLLPSIMSFPDGSCQVTLQQVAKQPIEQTTIEQSKPATDSNKGTGTDSESLKQRIQNLISMNAEIVNTPIAEPPRYKRPAVKQGSQGKGEVQPLGSTRMIHVVSPQGQVEVVSLSSILPGIGETITSSEGLQGIKSILDSEKSSGSKPIVLNRQSSEIAKQLAGLNSPAVIQPAPSMFSIGTDSLGKQIKLPSFTAGSESSEIKESVIEKIKEKLKRSDSQMKSGDMEVDHADISYNCPWCDVSFSERQIVELHKEYYCTGKQKIDTTNTMISTDKIIRLFSDVADKSGKKDVVKSYSLGQNMRVVSRIIFFFTFLCRRIE